MRRPELGFRGLSRRCCRAAFSNALKATSGVQVPSLAAARRRAASLKTSASLFRHCPANACSASLIDDTCIERPSTKRIESGRNLPIVRQPRFARSAQRDCREVVASLRETAKQNAHLSLKRRHPERSAQYIIASGGLPRLHAIRPVKRTGRIVHLVS
jgi:hypothetical protein